MATLTTVLYDPSVNVDPFFFDYLGYLQLPTTPNYPFPPTDIEGITDAFAIVPNLLATATRNATGITLNTDGSVFDGIIGYEPIPFYLSGDPPGRILIPTGRTLSATQETGYIGFTNYTFDIGDIDLEDLDLENLENSFKLEPVNPRFPELDPINGFSLVFDLTIPQESSVANRAGFSLLVVTSDPTKEIELGFKTDGSDRIFAQTVNFTEGETTTPGAVNLSVPQTYTLKVQSNLWELLIEETPVLSGSLRNYNFDPATSNPPLPEFANPYNVPNLIFFGDNTDQAFATFTLGTTILNVTQLRTPFEFPSIFDYEQFLKLQNPAAIIPTDTFGNLPLAQLFDENFYLRSNPDIGAAVAGGAFASGYQHFVTNGLFEGRNPSILYSEQDYLLNNPDVAVAKTNGQISSGLLHFFLSGNRELRDPSTRFSQEIYLLDNPDVDAAVKAGGLTSGFEHYIRSGADEGRLPERFLYNEAYYLDTNPDIAAAVVAGGFAQGYDHFVTNGVFEGRSPSLFFNETYYRARYPDIADAIANGSLVNGFTHFESTGRFENRPGSPEL